MMSYEIVLENCVFFGVHGVLPEEKRLGQRFFVDAVLSVESPDACESDNLSSTVDYGKAFSIIESIVTGSSCDLIEHLAYKIGESLCDEFSEIARASITVRKPSVPISGILDHVEVTVCYPS